MSTSKPEHPQSAPTLPRAPIPLSASQEAAVRELYYKRVRGHCGNEIRGDGRSLNESSACTKIWVEISHLVLPTEPFPLVGHAARNI